MSRYLTFSVKRSGVAVPSLSAVRAQLDNISLSVIAGVSGAIPHNSFTFISLDGVPDIRQGDLLTDASTADTKTASGFAEYRASGEPEPFEGDHLEIQITRVTVKTT